MIKLYSCINPRVKAKERNTKEHSKEAPEVSEEGIARVDNIFFIHLHIAGYLEEHPGT